MTSDDSTVTRIAADRTKTDLKPDANLPEHLGRRDVDLGLASHVVYLCWRSLEESEWWLGVDEATRQLLTVPELQRQLRTEPSMERSKVEAKEELRDWLRSISPIFTCYFQIMEENYAGA